MEAVTLQKYIHTSPRKLRLVADMVRKMEPNKALDILEFTPKAASKDLSAAIKVAMANAKKLGLDSQKAAFKILEVNESTKMRRIRPSARGRARPYKKRMSHIKIVLSDEGKADTQKQNKRKEAKSERDPSTRVDKSTLAQDDNKS